MPLYYYLLFLAVFERIYPNNISLTQNAVFDMATYTLILAFGQTILFRVNASSGGTDIIAKIVNKYTHIQLILLKIKHAIFI